MTFAEGYIDVAERIKKFKEAFPEGSLQAHLRPYLEVVADKTYVVYAAAAYRTPTDERPGVGYAWELVPGPTTFTKDSELMNAETSAWGRAIAALGFEVRNGVASKQEVESAQSKQGGFQAPATARGSAAGSATQAQVKFLRRLISELVKDGKVLEGTLELDCEKRYKVTPENLSKTQASEFIEKLKRLQANAATAADLVAEEGDFDAPDADADGIPF